MSDADLFSRIQIFSIVASIFMLLVIFKLIKRKKLKEEYSLLWIALGGAVLFLAIFESSLNLLAETLGILYPPAALLLVLIGSAFCILIQFSMVISRLSESNKNLVQEVGILNAEISAMKRDMKKEDSYEG